MDERYTTEVPMDADTLRTMGTALIKPATRLNLLAVGGGLLILAIILLTQGDREKCLLCVLALAVYGLGVTIYTQHVMKRAVEDMKRETGGIGWVERVSFGEDTVEHHTEGHDEAIPYGEFTQADLRGGLLVLHTKATRLVVHLTQLSKEDQSALCTMLWQRCPQLDMPRKLRPAKSKGEKRHGDGQHDDNGAA